MITEQASTTIQLMIILKRNCLTEYTSLETELKYKEIGILHFYSIVTTIEHRT